MKVTANAYFAIVPEWLIDAEVSDRAVRVYAILSRYADQRGLARPSRRTLAKRCRCSVDSIDRALRQLEECGAVKVTRRVVEGAFAPNEYEIQRLGGRSGAARGRGSRAA